MLRVSSAAKRLSGHSAHAGNVSGRVTPLTAVRRYAHRETARSTTTTRAPNGSRLIYHPPHTFGDASLTHAASTQRTIHNDASTNHDIASKTEQDTCLPGGWLYLADMHFDHARLDRLESTCTWLLSEIRRLRPSHIFLLGDTLHTRNEVHVKASSAAANFLKHILQTEYPEGTPPPHVHLLVGNHDMHLMSSRAVTSLDSFAVHDFTKQTTDTSEADLLTSSTEAIATSSSLLRLHMYREISLVDIDGQSVLFLPYHHGEECEHINRYISELAKTRDLSQIVCLAHLPLTGATISGIALDPKNTGHKYSHSSVSVGTLSQFKRVFLGHFHIHQLVGSSGKVLYVGAPMQFNYGDANDTHKGFVLYDPKERDPVRPWRLHSNPFGQYFISRPLSELKKELLSASSSPDGSSAFAAAYKDKCVEIVVPPVADPIEQEQVKQTAEEVEQMLRATRGIHDIKVKRLAVKERKPSDESTSPDASVDPDSLEDPFDSLGSTDDLRPLVRAFLEADQSLTSDTRDTLSQTMDSLLDTLLHAAGGGSTTKVTTPSKPKKLFHARLGKLIVTNFLSISDTLVFDFETLSSGVWYICGRNGSGKSLLLEALTWVLFGKTLRGHEADRISRSPTGLNQDEVVNDRMKKEASASLKPKVEVSISFLNGYTITRSHVYGVPGTIVRVDTPDGPLEQKSSKRLDDATIVELIGISFDRFISSVLLSSTTKNFISSRPEAKRRVIEDLLGFTQFESLQSESKDRRSSLLGDRKALEAFLGVAQENHATWLSKVENDTKMSLKLKEDLSSKQTALQNMKLTTQSKLDTQVLLDEAEKNALASKNAQHATLVRIQSDLETMRMKVDQDYVKGLLLTKSVAEKKFTMGVQQKLQTLYATQQRLTEQLGMILKQASEARLAESQTLQRRIESLAQVDQARVQLELAQRKLALATPAWLTTLVQVLDELLDWVVKYIPDALRSRFDASIIQPLEGVVRACKEASSSSAASKEVAKRQAELTKLTKDQEWPTDIPATLTQLRNQQQELAKAHTIASTPEQQLQLQKSHPTFVELQTVKDEIALLTTNPRTSKDESLVAALAELTLASDRVEQYNASNQAHRDSEATLNAQRRTAEEILNGLTKAEQAARKKARAHETERLGFEVNKARSEKDVELAAAVLTKHEAALTLLRSDGPKLIAAIESAQASLNTCTRQISSLTYWLDRISDAPTKQEDGFRTFCIRRVLGTLNPRLQENLDLFSQDDTGRVTHPLGCVLTPELNLVAAPGSPSLEKRSEGQRKRTHLALFLALFDLSQRRSTFINQFLFLDEAFDTLDEDGQKAVNTWIKQYANGATNQQQASEATPIASESTAPLVFVITHSSYTNPSESNGCIRVALDSQRNSTYTLDAPGLILSRPFVHQLTSSNQTLDGDADDAETTVRAPRKKKATSTPRTKKVKQANAPDVAEMARPISTLIEEYAEVETPARQTNPPPASTPTHTDPQPRTPAPATPPASGSSSADPDQDESFMAGN